MLLRGQNLVGYRHYPDDVVEKFVEVAYRNGIDIFRVFDALNDVRNLVTSIRKAKSVGAIVQGAICYTVSPVHSLEYYMRFAEELVALEVDMITIKDMAGILDPYIAYTMVKELKSRFKISVTPLSQIVGTQAVFNVLLGRYKVIIKEVMDYVAGYYGRPPGPSGPELRERVLKSVPEVTTRPADLLKPELGRCYEAVRELEVPATDENALTYCLFPEVAVEFLKEVYEEYIRRSRELEVEVLIGYAQ